MNDSATQIKQAHAASVEGIELFEPFEKADGHDPIETVEAQLADNDWTPDEAAKALGKSVRTIRRMLQDGILKGYKVAGKRREEWRVKPVTVSANETDTVPFRNTLMTENDRLWQLLKEKDAKLEALTMRTGYLEAQLDNHKEQIKLLTDSQHKIGWWRKAWRWFARSTV